MQPVLTNQQRLTPSYLIDLILPCVLDCYRLSTPVDACCFNLEPRISNLEPQISIYTPSRTLGFPALLALPAATLTHHIAWQSYSLTSTGMITGIRIIRIFRHLQLPSAEGRRRMVPALHVKPLPEKRQKGGRSDLARAELGILTQRWVIGVILMVSLRLD